MKVTFYLRKEKKSKQTGLIPVAVLVTESGLIVRKNIPGVKVLEEDWNKLMWNHIDHHLRQFGV